MRTTNTAESYHGHLKYQFYKAQFRSTVIFVSLKLQSETFLFMNPLPNKKFRTPH